MFGSSKARDRVFFQTFSEHAQRSVEAAQLLLEMFENPATKEKLALAISEKRGRATASRTTRSSGSTRPGSRLSTVSTSTASSASKTTSSISIEAVSERMVLFEITTVRAPAVELARVLLKACEDLLRATKLFEQLAKASKEIVEICVEINRLENEADAIYRRAIAELFKAGNDPIDVMKWRDIFDNLESATDRCEDVANIIEGVVLEYA